LMMSFAHCLPVRGDLFLEGRTSDSFKNIDGTLTDNTFLGARSLCLEFCACSAFKFA
jgi:hypothetical protein